jgi:hypothetical protein
MGSNIPNLSQTDAGLVGGLFLAMDVNERFKRSPEVLIRERELEKHWDMR